MQFTAVAAKVADIQRSIVIMKEFAARYVLESLISSGAFNKISEIQFHFSTVETPEYIAHSESKVRFTTPYRLENKSS